MKRFTVFTAALALLVLCAAADAQDAGQASPVVSSLATPELDQDPAVTGSKASLMVGALLLQYSQKELSQGVYVGSEFCLACHQSYTPWKDTLHANFLRRPLTQFSLVPRRGVIADYDGNGVDDFIQGLDFNQISSAFDAYKPNAPILSVENGIYYITIGALKCPVTFTQAGQGGSSSQRYVVKIPVSDTRTGLTASNYFAPLQYSPLSGWGPNSPQNWYDASNQPRWGPGTTTVALGEHSGNYSETCVGCHSTGIRRVGPNNATGEISFDAYVAVLFERNNPSVFDYDGDGIFDLMNIGCESCHGAGSAHVMTGGDPDYIVDPDELSAAAKNDICGRCHTRPKSVPNGDFDWPYDDATGTDWTPRLAEQGVPLGDFFTDASLFWPDGKHRRVTRPYHDFLESSKPTFQFRQVSCPDCHDPHEESQAHQIRDLLIEDGIPIQTAVEDNTLCLACHAGFGDFEELTKENIADIEEVENQALVARVVAAHTNHPYAPERTMGLSRCVECHMPVTAGFGTLSLPSHTFEAISPEKTLAFQDEGGMPNSCAQSCHGTLVNSFGLGLDPNPSNAVWNEVFDRDLAEALAIFYGAGGVWWDTDEDGE